MRDVLDIFWELAFGLLCGYIVGVLSSILIEHGQQWRRRRGAFVYPIPKDYSARLALLFAAVNLVRACFFDHHFFGAAWWLLWVAVGAYLAVAKKRV